MEIAKRLFSDVRDVRLEVSRPEIFRKSDSLGAVEYAVPQAHVTIAPSIAAGGTTPEEIGRIPLSLTPDARKAG